MRVESIAGIWQVDIGDGPVDGKFPASLDENLIGHKDDGSNLWKRASLVQTKDGGEGVIPTRFTRRVTFEGQAKISRTIDIKREGNERVFLSIERARHLRLFINGTEIEPVWTANIASPYVFELSDFKDGQYECLILSDNSYPTWPREAIVYSSAATDETQTNWNGLLGKLDLHYVPQNCIKTLRIYPKGQNLDVFVELSAMTSADARLVLRSGALAETLVVDLEMSRGEHELKYTLPLNKDVRLWDEEEGHLYLMEATLESLGQVASRTERFGVREFSINDEGRLSLNGRSIFVRSETNCAVFPKTGYSPMTKEEWTDVLGVFRSYGVNLMRFHSHCPPIAAFEAADEMGMLMQPELNHWNATDAFEPEADYEYYKTEVIAILRMLANHPSFVMFSWGNELCTGDLGLERMTEFILMAKDYDPTRLYANASNAFYGAHGADPNSDFYTSQKYGGSDLRGSFAGHKGGGVEGFINEMHPNTSLNYDDAIHKLRQDFDGAVFSFEVGQFEVFPDFDEINRYDGITDPGNYRLVRDKVEDRGLMEKWPRYVEASGEMSILGYRAEVEAALRTRGLSGMSLLGLQDFPGQGTAIVGMLNALLESKPYPFAKPERFRAFFRADLPLVLLDRFTYEESEDLIAKLQFANFTKDAVNAAFDYRLIRQTDGVVLAKGSFDEADYAAGKLHDVATLEISLPALDQATRFDLEVEINGIQNSYPIWVYPRIMPRKPDSVYETKVFDDKAIQVLKDGGKVYLTPAVTKEAMPNSIETQLTTDFWSVGTFPEQEGGMGQFIDKEHPLFKDFPTDMYSSWQWWPMATTRALILPHEIDAIVTEMDSYAYLRPMAKLFECECLNGRLLVSSMGLQDLQEHPEARSLLSSIYVYMDSDEFKPDQRFDTQWIQQIFKSKDN